MKKFLAVLMALAMTMTMLLGCGGGAAAGGGQAPDNRIEMVAESDYEFVVRAAKKFNFEFFHFKYLYFFKTMR